SPGPPTATVLASAESETAWPSFGNPLGFVPCSLPPGTVHVPLLRTHTQLAPARSPGPPISAVFPSPDNETALPCLPPTVPGPISIACCVHVPLLRTKTQDAPVPVPAVLSALPPIRWSGHRLRPPPSPGGPMACRPYRRACFRIAPIY